MNYIPVSEALMLIVGSLLISTLFYWIGLSTGIEIGKRKTEKTK